MKVETLHLSETNLFSKIINDYINENPYLSEFYGHPPTLEGIMKALEERKFPMESRKVLTLHLSEQYNSVVTNPSVVQNVESLNQPNTFTITTGHQLNIFTGPLYFIYKIAGTIHLARTLKEAYPDYNFVPIYWMASEDHDIDEINHFRLFKKTYSWQTDQSGAVGRYNCDEGFNSIFENILETPDLFKNAYIPANTLAEATLSIVNELFGKHGLVCLNADSKSLKKLFIPVLKEEIINQTSYKGVFESSSKMVNGGYKTQVNPREINLFYMEGNLRNRIVYEDNQYSVVDTDLKFSKSEILALVESNPEKFSPNVILRPVYQEVILPNLVYLGGPGEIHYWLQLKESFDRLQVSFPVLMLRDFILFMNKPMTKKLDKIGLSPIHIFGDYHALKKEISNKNSNSEDLLSSSKQALENVFNQLADQIPDDGTKRSIDSERQKVLNQFKKLESKINKYFEGQSETSIRQLDAVKEYAFPNNKPQERVDNFLNFYINDHRFIDEIIECCNPLDKRYKIILGD